MKKLLLFTFLGCLLFACSGDDETSEPDPIPDTVTVVGFSETMDENSAVNDVIIGVVTSTNNHGGTPTYSITSQNASGALAVNSSTGAITVADASQFDYDAYETITATVQASTEDANNTATVSIALNNISDLIFQHTATPENSEGHITYLDHPDLNNNPDARFVFTKVNLLGVDGVYNSNIQGIYYNGSQWAIFNEDTNNPMVENSVYNVMISKDGDAIVHTHTDDTWISTIDHPALNNNPDAVPIITNYWTPFGIYNDNNVGLAYDTSINQWRVYNESGTALPLNSSYIILLSDDAETMVHQSSTSNVTDFETAIDHPSLNANADAKFMVSAVSATGSINAFDSTVGIWDRGPYWAIYSEVFPSLFPNDIEYSILILND